MPELMIAPAISGSALSRANPFPGLRPYEEEDANWFFGRSGEVNELLKRLRRLHMIAVVGASGSGKSSLVRAGLLPQIRDGYLDAAWTIATFRPGERPIANLAEAVCPPGVGVEEFTRGLHSGPQGLVRGLGSTPGKVLILVDQFEELFQFARRTGDAAQEEVKEFLKLLLAAAQSDDVDVYVVLTMRLEWLNECASYPGLAEAINESIYLVPQMTRRQFQQAILGPLEAAGGSITTALLSRMLNDLDNKTDQLPVLQHALMRIWERRGASDAFGSGDYEAVGTFSNCLSAHAEEVYAELNERQKKVAELLFRNITQVYQNRKIRRPRPVGEIAKAAKVGVEELAPVIQAFSRAGRSFLVTTQGALRPESIVDVSHEALIRQWVRLCGWVEDEADRQGRVSRLETDAGEWDRDRTRFRESLYAGYELLRAEELRPSLDSSSVALAFLNESRRVKLRRRLVKRGSITGALVLLALFAFLFQRQRSRGALREAEKRAEIAHQQAKYETEIASLQAKRAVESRDQLVQQIEGAHGSATALAAIAKEVSAERVYVQYAAGDTKLASEVQEALQTQGYSVPGVERVDPAKAPAQTQVRFFHPEDRADATKIASRVKGLAGSVSVQAVANPNGVVPAGQFEVWMSPSVSYPARNDSPVHNGNGIPTPPGPGPGPAGPPPVSLTVSISANVFPDRVLQGKSSKLSWESTNASEVVIEGVGTEPATGSVLVTPQQTTTYRLTAKGEGGAASVTTIEVQVMPPMVQQQVLPPAPAPGGGGETRR